MAIILRGNYRQFKHGSRQIRTRNSLGDEIPERDIALFCYTNLVFNAPTEGFPWDDLRKILRGGQRMARVQNGIEILPKVSIS